MSNVFLTKLNLDSKEGIYKKIVSEAISMSRVGEETYFIHKSDSGIKITLFENGIQKLEDEIKGAYFVIVWKFLQNKDIKVVYVRHMIPSFKEIRLLRKLKKKKVEIFYEIPTYPYFYEQYKVSKNKLRAIVKLSLDAFFLPVIYRLSKRFVVVLSNKKKKIFRKMLIINNGVTVDKSIDYKHVNLSDRINMICVGTIYPYHGYDRLINMIGNDERFVVDLYGESDTLKKLEMYCSQNKISNFNFKGKIDNKLLMKKYNDYDFGVGALALDRRKADIDTTLKVAEYLSCGLPIISSGSLFYKESKLDKYVVRFDQIKAADLFYEHCVEMYKYDLSQISGLAQKLYDWDSIFTDILRNGGNE